MIYSNCGAENDESIPVLAVDDLMANLRIIHNLAGWR